jgi:hypothetical protein
MGNQIHTAPPIASHDLLAVLREIEDAKKQLSDLYVRKAELEEIAKNLRNAPKKAEKEARRKESLKIMQMAASGMSVPKIAEQLGISKHNLDQRISKAWRKEFPAHFREKRRYTEMGLLEALRDSPPLFSSANA